MRVTFQAAGVLVGVAWSLAAQHSEAALETAAPVRVLALQAKTAHVQGIDTGGAHLWVTSVDRTARKGYLQEFALPDGRLERTIEIQDGVRFHPGGIATDANSIWIPVAEYRPSSTSVIERRNKRSFELEFRFAVPDHIGCIAVTPDLLIGGNWDGRDFYFWDHQGKLIRKVPSATANAYQDMKVSGGRLVASGLLAGHRAAIDWLDLSSLALIHRARLGNTDTGQPLTREGMTLREDRLMLLPEDGASRLFVFALPSFVPARN
jgi:Family of unknown function (DUF6454)